MNELLRLANKLVEASDKIEKSTGRKMEAELVGFHGKIELAEVGLPNAYFIFMTLAVNHAVDIIKGYQELLRQTLTYINPDDFVGMPDLQEQCKTLYDKVKSSIPEEH